MLKSLLKPFVSLSLVVCLLGLLPARAMAWGGEGHRMVAEIAMWRLSRLKARNALQQVNQILQAGPRTVEEAAVWPDTIRDIPAYKFTGPLHYVNIPNVKDSFERATVCKPTPDVPEGNCVVGGIEHFRAVLTNPASNPQARLDALSFIIHFIGDLHQPLHTSEDTTFVNSDGKTGDAGGNLKIIFYLDEQAWSDPDEKSCERNPDACSYIDFQGKRRRRNLHAAWDSYMIGTQMAGMKVSAENKKTKDEIAKIREQQYVAMLEKRIDRLSRQQIAQIEQGDPVKWVEESHAMGVEYAYCLPPPRHKLNVADQQFYNHYFLGREYQSANIRRIDTQLIAAGLRLAAYLRQIYPDTP